MGNSGAVLCLAVPLLAMILALYALLYDRHEIGRMLGGPWRRYRYQRYLRSERWRLLRKQVLRRAGWRCECCGRRGPLDVHHLTYERFGRELLGDLQALCRDCHDGAHREARGRDPTRPHATPRRYQRGST
jgi:5-methylcytosine-specific restriction endonuclease McrA